MNRITELFKNKKGNVLNVFFTAGFPQLNDTTRILESLEKSGADMVEIGMPYSDPMADGPVIQESNGVALANGMSIKVLFEQLEGIREKISIPILLMGYFNPVIQYGVEAFFRKAKELGVDGVILPDLPMAEYEDQYKGLFEELGLSNVFLVTPQTTEERLAKIDSVSNGFIYIVSTNSTTGNDTKAVEENTDAYFNRVNAAGLKNPKLIGFNIKDNATFSNACKHAEGAIIGSAFIKVLQKGGDLEKNIPAFVNSVKGN